MTSKLLSFLLVLLPLTSLSSQASANYAIHDGQVIFKFNEDCFSQNSDECYSIKDFEALGLMNAIKTGNYKSWTKDGWTIVKVGPKEYELHKSLDHFKEKLAYEDRFLIDGSLWKMPFSEPLFEGGKKIKEEIKVVKVNPRGNAIFALKGHLNAKEVILAGSFNRWNEKELKMVKSAEGWKLILDLPAGIYEYKFIVDGQWTHDTANKNVVENEHQTLNSILTIGKTVNFNLAGHTTAKNVILSGSFNNWNERVNKMTKTKNGWTFTQQLPPGKHYYKFIVDGKWITDPANDLIQNYAPDIVNSVLILK